MRMLLDDSLPSELQSELPGHNVRAVQEMGWSSLRNGELLARSVNQFDLFLTADENLRYQQNLASSPIAVAVLVATSNRIGDLHPLIPELLATLAGLRPRTLVEVGGK